MINAKMDNVRAAERESNYLVCPLVAVCKIGDKPLLLKVKNQSTFQMHFPQRQFL